MAMKEVGQQSCVMIASVVEDDDHAAAGRLLAQQAPEESPERGGVEDRAHHAYELSGVQTDGPKAGHRFSGRRMPQDRVLDFGRHPHAAPRTVLLEVTFIQTPQFDVGTTSQTPQFFLLPRLSADPIGRLGVGAYVIESPVLETVAGIAAHRGPLHIADASVPTTPARPTGWPPSRSHVGSCASPTATCANPSHPACAGGPIARLRAERPGRPPRSDSPSAAPSCRSRQTVRRPRGRTAPPSPAAIRAVGGRSETPRYAQSLAGSLFASPQHPRSAACASFFSRRNERSNDTIMLHYLCRCV